MDTIARISLALCITIRAMVVLLGLRNRLMLKLGPRNIPRRPARTVLTTPPRSGS